MAWADNCCERLMGARNNGQERATMSSRSVLIRWQYVTSQIMRDLVSSAKYLVLVDPNSDGSSVCADYSK
jgi:hypothetical protein